MFALHAVMGLLLLGVLRAFPQGRAPTDPCVGDPSRYYDEAAGRCCYRCPEGLSPKQLCPQGPSDCRKQCEPDYYLNGQNRCTACVSCGDDLVEKKPCSWNSPRVCECRAGMFCLTSAAHSCARCAPHSVCSAEMIVKFPGTAERDTICESPSPGASPDCGTSPEDCKAPASGTSPQAMPIPTSASSRARTMLLGEDTPRAPEDDAKMMRAPNSLSSEGKPSLDPGLSPQHLCPLGSADCRKQCEPDYYLDRDGRCTACVSCSGGDLVEKTPCTWNSSRVCECRPGMFCVTSATNSCARCTACPIIDPEVATKLQGKAEKDTTYEPSNPGTHLNCSTNPEDSEVPASTSPSWISPADSQASEGRGGGATHARWDASISTSAPVSFSSSGRTILVSGSVLFWAIVVLVVVMGTSSFLLYHRKACWKWIRQKLHLCYPVQTFQLMPEPVDSRPQRTHTEWKGSVLVAQPCTEVLGLMSPPSVETSPNMGAACLESLPLVGASPAGSPSSPRDLPEPRVTTEHTNNRIEKIYIMKADTVIVGTVKTEVPEGRGLAGPAEPELEEDLEVDHAPHYPEQETEPPLGSCRDVMFSVEEEGKADPLPTTASGK
ncbi:tumor necrosis factor receptor superfamily member 8 [Molossus molossus]|uniref:TNF receptor superfamily member 8 n=1 Tax=Molossus molossus TaxID=27622 RepID=A0A7J8FE45_MOLMO|nr:tumor necrosis factor receptor superfamily member 8 [Molossus molossus]KAF6445442.1 TNF receptor superfamily member 8 [Molossus molossus]